MFDSLLPNQWMRGPIPQRMIGQELFQNNNLICIFTQKIKLFWLKKYDQGFSVHCPIYMEDIRQVLQPKYNVTKI